MSDENDTPVVLTHNMRAIRGPDGKNAGWRCIDCGRSGTIRFINTVVCVFLKSRGAES